MLKRTYRGAALCGCLGTLLCCSSNHHVSPWVDPAILPSLLAPGRVEPYLEQMDNELRQEGMSSEYEVTGKFRDGSPFVLRSYVGENAVRARRHAVRMATNYGVILAIGPSQPVDLLQKQRTRLVRSLADGGWNSGSDLNGDGLIDVVVGGSDGTFEIWGAHPSGASPYRMDGFSPNRVEDVDDDGRPDLVADIDTGIGESGRVQDVMLFDAGAYRNDGKAVRAYHQKQSHRLRRALDYPGDAGLALGEFVDIVGRWTWHEMRSGVDSKSALERAERMVQRHAPLPQGASQAWVRWRGWLGEKRL